MKIDKNRFRSDKGAITLFVLVACLFFTFILSSVYIANLRKLQTQELALQRIKENYEKIIEDVNGDENTPGGGGGFVPSDTPEERPEEDTTDPNKAFPRNYGVIEVEFLSGTSYYVSNIANVPKLGTGMKAVYWDESGNEVVQGDAGFDNSKWYSYIAQTGYTTSGGTSKWANAKTEDGSYWVWIPRYAYRIVYFDTKQHAEDYRFGTLSEADAVTNEYIVGYSDARGMVYPNGKSIVNISDKSTAIAVNEKKFRTHPAFCDGTSNNYENGGWDSEITGIWVAKYEMSREDSTDGNTWIPTTVSYGGGNNLTTNAGNTSSTQIRTVSKPGVTSWRNIYVGNMYTNSYNYSRTLESHLMKNSEWGAVAYLTDSKYGRNGTEITINNNSSYYTGGGANTSYKTNLLQSTTGNIYGIYDMSGGTREYVAAFNAPGKESYLTNYGNSFASLNGTSTKYATTYENTNSDYSEDFTLGKVSYLGDAMQEIFLSGTEGWYSDYVGFTSTSYPFLTRGGYCDGGTGAGVFNSYSGHGYSSTYFSNSFRAVLVP